MDVNYDIIVTSNMSSTIWFHDLETLSFDEYIDGNVFFLVRP